MIKNRTPWSAAQASAFGQTGFQVKRARLSPQPSLCNQCSRMKKLIQILFPLLFHQPLLATDLVLSPGEVQTLPAPNGAAISVERGEILQVQDLAAKVKLVAKRSGQSRLQIGSNVYHVSVVSGQTKAHFQLLRQLLNEFRGLKILVTNDLVIEISGQLHRHRDWQAIADLARKHKISYAFTAKIDDDVQSEVRKWLLPFVRGAGLSEDTLYISPDPKVFVSAQFTKNLSQYKNRLQPFGLLVETQAHQISQLPSVMLDLVLAEIDKTFEQEIGILWGQAEQTGVYKAKVLPNITEGELFAQINLIESEGHGQILARPSLLSRSGEKAEFHAGGEMPIRISGWGSQSVEWKKYGIMMAFRPRADNEGRMSLTIETEVSIPNLNQTTDQLPIFEVNRVKSHFDLDQSRTVVISGLIRNSQNEFRQGLPFLSRIPVLGRLFGSPKYQSRKTELVVFVTPRVLKPSELDSVNPESFTK